MPRIPAILVSPCCNANCGNGATPNFARGTLNAPMLRSSSLAALIFLDVPRPNCAEIRVDSETSPSDLTKLWCKMVTKAPVSISKRVGWPWIEHDPHGWDCPGQSGRHDKICGQRCGRKEKHAGRGNAQR